MEIKGQFSANFHIFQAGFGSTQEHTKCHAHFRATMFTVRIVENKIRQTLVPTYTQDRTGRLKQNNALRLSWLHIMVLSCSSTETNTERSKMDEPRLLSILNRQHRRVRGLCHFSACPSFPSLFYPAVLSSIFVIRLTSYFGSSENTPAASADVMIHSVVTSLKKK